VYTFIIFYQVILWAACCRDFSFYICCIGPTRTCKCLEDF